MDLIERFGWRSYTILYEDNQGLVRLQELLKSPTQSDVKIVVRQLPSEDDYRSVDMLLRCACILYVYKNTAIWPHVGLGNNVTLANCSAQLTFITNSV